MRRFLYISPYFPPMTRVGALRPLKFARHLPRHGWAPIVLCDLRRADEMSRALLDFVPESTVVVRDYSAQARGNEQRFARGELPLPPYEPPSWALRGGLLTRLAQTLASARRSPTYWWPSEEFLPLGRHALDMPHGLRAARRVLREHPECEAIMVNADPFAALLVGARLARETGLPLVQDLRDPWAYCSLRRGERLPPQRLVIDRLERRAFAPASAVIFNTQQALADYLPHYADLGRERFHVLRNSGDAELVARGERPPFDRFTVLFLGSFRRYVEGGDLVAALALLRRQGITEEQLHLVVSGHVPPSLLALAERLGVAGMLRKHPFVPYCEIGPMMERADLLLAISNATPQRIPAKLYDYATTRRPMLVIADNQELAGLLDRLGGAQALTLGDVEGIAVAILAAFRAGRGREVPREVPRAALGLDSASSAARLAEILDAVTVSGSAQLLSRRRTSAAKSSPSCRACAAQE